MSERERERGYMYVCVCVCVCVYCFCLKVNVGMVVVHYYHYVFPFSLSLSFSWTSFLFSFIFIHLSFPPPLSLSPPHSISNPPSLQQLHCFTAACGYDGGDGSCSFTNTTDAWSQCPYPECRTNYNNDVCDQKCNNAPCLYDGRDCTFLLPTCPAE